MKKMRILIMTLISILLIGTLTFAGIYFFTDILKSNQERFYKYAVQITNKENFSLTEQEKKYLEKIENEKTKATIDLNIKASREEEKIVENLNITYLGLNDPENKFAKQKLNVINDNEEFIELTFIKDSDLYGLMIKDILNKYMTIENKNLKELAKKLGIEDVSNIPDKIEEIKLSEILTDAEEIEKINKIMEKYSDIIKKEIPKTNYSKIKETIMLDSKEVETTGYRLSLTELDLYNLLYTLIEEMKEDKEIYSLLSNFDKVLGEENISYEEYKKQFENLLIEMNNLQVEELEEQELIQINLYQQSNKLVKSEMIIFLKEEKTNIICSIEKLDNKTIYNIDMKAIETDGTYYEELYNIQAIQKINGDINTWDFKIAQKIGTESKEFVNMNIVTKTRKR